MPIINDIVRNNKQLRYTRVNYFSSVTTMQLEGGQTHRDSRGLEDLGTVRYQWSQGCQ